MWEKRFHNATHYVKTGYGIKHGKYKYSKESSIIGPGQGSQGVMAACGTTSTPQL